MFLLIGEKTNNTDFDSDVERSVKIKDCYFKLENWKDSVLLSEIVKEKSTLILRIPRVNCQPCKYNELENLRQFSQKNSFNTCAVLTVDGPRELKSLVIKYDYQFSKIGSKLGKVLNLSEEISGKPYYFVLDSNLQASRFFIPDMLNQNLTEQYFDQIRLEVEGQ